MVLNLFIFMNVPTFAFLEFIKNQFFSIQKVL